MIKFIAGSVALTFALGMVCAQSVAAYPSFGASGRAVHHHAPRAASETRLSRPIFAQPPRQNLPAISRNPEDCIRTMCTCLRGGGC
jgi:hypothetical protein